MGKRKTAPAQSTPKPGWARPLPAWQRGMVKKRYRQTAPEERTPDVVESDTSDPYQPDIKDEMYWDGHSALPESDDVDQEPILSRGAHREARVRAHIVRSVERGSTGDLDADTWALIRAAFLQKCAYCGTRVANEEVIEHVVPVCQGGATDEFNCVPACAMCNSTKRARDPLEWMGHNAAWVDQFFGRVIAAGERYARLKEERAA